MHYYRRPAECQERLGPESTLRPHNLAANQADAQFLRRAIEPVDRHLSDFDFDVQTWREGGRQPASVVPQTEGGDGRHAQRLDSSHAVEARRATAENLR